MPKTGAASSRLAASSKVAEAVTTSTSQAERPAPIKFRPRRAGDRRDRQQFDPWLTALPTARTTLCTGYVRVRVICNSCRHQADADLQAIVESGRGDMPLTELRFRCSQCGTYRTDCVVTSRHNPQPW